MLLKEVYNQKFITQLAEKIRAIDQNFNQEKFLKILSPEILAKKELKQRMRAITLALNESLFAKEYPQKIAVLKQAAIEIPKDKNSQLALIIFADFIEVFGGEDFDFSMQALAFFTEFGSAEFAVRKFIKLDCKRALGFFEIWSHSKNHHIRRLASEGLRPRLPWGCALTEFKKNPAAILPILENLKFDESEYVRRSVANNLNDISKDHPALVLQILQKWQKEKVSEKLLKHALRGLLKKGDKAALALIGIEAGGFVIDSFFLEKTEIKIGEELFFGFALQNQGLVKKVRLEYAIYFLKKNGSHSKKIFQIAAKNQLQFNKKHSFRNLATRKHYVGKHLISLVVNGIELQKLCFDLI
jgi:3-methyladenine DNA glycosylase AlkC